ncbi:Indole-3-acetaldehyde oxidase [Acorus calamus]|uniref:Indole-3-acetaldehyde oxidase n=1 Tax=Acorus calamus TaxID=4465 RepID=A0AAV9BZT8_ACOCL|nr:Indole-3-acetaldehyde oxidase [Acorus calamus]
MKVTYSVGFKSDGKITALNVDILINASINEDVSPLLQKAIIGALQKYNWGTLSFDVRICKTNLTSKSAMRAPGDVQGSYIAEAVIEHVASTLSMDTNSVRKKNLHIHESLQLFYKDSSGEPHEYTLPAILEKLANTSSFNHRSEMIKHFNMRNKWRKRGISSVPIVFEVSLRPSPGRVGILNDGSVVVEVHLAFPIKHSPIRLKSM